MSLINWDKVSKTGILSIDEQHHNLVKLINKLHIGLMNGESYEVFGEALEELLEYSHYHFKFEENLFTELKFDGAEEHKKVHEELVKKVKNYHDRFKSGDITLIMDVIQFLKIWLIEHIEVEDKKYIELFLKNQIN